MCTISIYPDILTEIIQKLTYTFCILLQYEGGIAWSIPTVECNTGESNMDYILEHGRVLHILHTETQNHIVP